jgi:hypothetical protein
MAKPMVWGTRLLLLTLAFSYCGGPQFLRAQTAENPPQASPQQSEPQPQPGNQGIVNPSQGPLTPVPSGEANTPPAPAQTEATAPEMPAPQKPPEHPAGTAVGEAGKTAGGPASRPAGNAIAPAKQRQTRSLLIKIGVLAAAGVAVGTVAALTHGTPSKPPGAK